LVRALPRFLGMFRSIILVATFAFFAACSTTEYAGPVVTPEAIANIRSDHPGEELTVMEMSSEQPGHAKPSSTIPTGVRAAPAPMPRVTLLETTPRGTRLEVSGEAAARIVPNDAIRRIAIVRHGQAAAKGVGIGIALGVATGLLAAVTYKDPCANSSDFTCGIGDLGRRGDSILIGGAVGVTAALFGAIVGGLIGERSNYVFGPQ
jgi:hypothetical protein